jgi:hypothetical protein
MTSTAYPRIGGWDKSELHAVGVLRPSRWPRSSLSSVPNSKQPQKSKRDRYWLYKREEQMERIPIEKTHRLQKQSEGASHVNEREQTHMTNVSPIYSGYLAHDDENEAPI